MDRNVLFDLYWHVVSDWHFHRVWYICATNGGNWQKINVGWVQLRMVVWVQTFVDWDMDVFLNWVWGWHSHFDLISMRKSKQNCEILSYCRSMFENNVIWLTGLACLHALGMGDPHAPKIMTISLVGYSIYHFWRTIFECKLTWTGTGTFCYGIDGKMKIKTIKLIFLNSAGLNQHIELSSIYIPWLRDRGRVFRYAQAQVLGYALAQGGQLEYVLDNVPIRMERKIQWYCFTNLDTAELEKSSIFETNEMKRCSELSNRSIRSNNI